MHSGPYFRLNQTIEQTESNNAKKPQNMCMLDLTLLHLYINQGHIYIYIYIYIYMGIHGLTLSCSLTLTCIMIDFFFPPKKLQFRIRKCTDSRFVLSVPYKKPQNSFLCLKNKKESHCASESTLLQVSTSFMLFSDFPTEEDILEIRQI